MFIFSDKIMSDVYIYFFTLMWLVICVLKVMYLNDTNNNEMKMKELFKYIDVYQIEKEFNQSMVLIH